MYNPNEKNSTNPPLPAQNYGAVYNQGNYNNYGNNQNHAMYNNLPYQNKDYSYDIPNNVTANGGLYDEFSLNEFSSVKIRHGFIRKVYSLLSIQLLITFGFSTLAVLYNPFNRFVINNYGLFLILSLAINLPILISLVCVPSLAKKYPTNYLLLLLLTIGTTLMTTVASARTESDIFFYALGTTSIVVVGLTIFAFQTKWDFTKWYIYMYVAFLILIFLSLIGIFVRSRIFNLVIAGICAFVLSISIIIDTQLIVGGKHNKYEFSIDDYIFATLALYMDIVNLFITILSIFSNAE